MASNKISMILDLEARSFTQTLKSIGTSVGEADGLMGKLKAGAKSTFDGLKQYSGEAALAAGTAIAAFALKAVGSFESLALASGKFSDAVGISVDDASRWIEVAGDLGISTETVQGAFQRMNKSIADGKPALKDFGIEIVHTKDGLVDANATFVNAITTIGAIEDPTLRAKAAQEVFGKSYGEVAELMNKSASDLHTALDGVSKAKVISPEELAKARKFREAIDALRDKMEDAALTIGEDLVPQLTALAEVTVQTIGVVEKLEKVLEKGHDLFSTNREDARKVAVQFKELAPAIEEAGLNFGHLEEAVLSGSMTIEDVNQLLAEQVDITDRAANKASYYSDKIKTELSPAVIGLSKDVRDDADAMDEAAIATAGLKRKYEDLTGKLDRRESWLNLLDDIDAYKAKMTDGTSTTREQEQATIDVRQSLIDYTASLKDVPAKTETQILALIDQGEYDRVKALLDGLAEPRAVRYTPTGDAIGGGPRRAAGGPVLAGKPYTVGERGSETFVPASDGTIVPHGVGGGVIVNINGVGRSMGDRQLAYMNGGLINAQVRGARRRP